MKIIHVAPQPEGHLTSLAAAQRELRHFLQENSGEGVALLFEGGTYFLAEPLILEAADSGTSQTPVVLRAAPSARVVLSGGQRITNWQVQQHQGRECWVAPVEKGWHFTQLWVNGERRFRPRLPREGFYRFTGMDGQKDSGSHWGNGPDRAQYAEGNLHRWKNLADVELIAPQLWFTNHFRIAHLDEERRVVGFQSRALGSLHDDSAAGYTRYWVENVFEALEERSTWYLDRAGKSLYYLPREGETPENTEVIAPRLQTLVEFRGGPVDASDGEAVRHVVLENLSLHHAQWSLPPDNTGAIQAAFNVPGAVVFGRAQECALYNCEIAHVAGYGIELGHGSSGCTVAACAIHDLGAGGVRVNHEAMKARTATGGGVEPESAPRRATVADCTIRDGGRIFPSCVGIWVGNCGWNRIAHNHLFDLSYTGISCGWSWGYGATRTVANRIEWNHVHHINQKRLLSDNGAIYTLGIQPGSVMRGNHIHDVDCYHYGGWGIYPDEGSSDWLIENNIVHHTRNAGYAVHYGRDLLVQNNIFALADGEHLRLTRSEAHRTSLLRRNIVLLERGAFYEQEWTPQLQKLEDNLFHQIHGDFDWSGFDMDSNRVADPLFGDAQSRDFSLRADSPALAMGFQPIDTSRIGPRFQTIRPASFGEWQAFDEAERARHGETVSLPVFQTELSSTGEGRFLENGCWETTVEARVTNRGQSIAQGQLTLRAAASGTTVEEAAPFEFQLAPGAVIARTFVVRAETDAGHLAVESTFDGGRSSLKYLAVNIPQRLARTQLTDGNTLTGAAWDGLPAMKIVSGEREVARLRMAHDGTALGVDIQVQEADLRRSEPIYSASCVEIMACLEDSAASKEGAQVHSNIRQLILLPAPDSRTAEVFAMTPDGPQSVSGAAIGCEPTPTGYTMRAILPWEILGLPAQCRSLRFDMAVNAAARPGSAHSRHALFGNASPFNDSRYGRLLVAG